MSERTSERRCICPDEVREREGDVHLVSCPYGRERIASGVAETRDTRHRHQDRKSALDGSAEGSLTSEPKLCKDGGECGLGGYCKDCPHRTSNPLHEAYVLIYQARLGLNHKGVVDGVEKWTASADAWMARHEGRATDVATVTHADD